MQVQLVQAKDVRQQRRIQRRPQHSFSVKAKPYEICPICIAPVLPGETIQNLLWQDRVVSDPIKSSLTGWWQEYYYFYVPLPHFRHSALNIDNDGLLQLMMLDPSTDVSELKAAAISEPLYTFKGGMDYVYYCLESVIAEHFRTEDDFDTTPIDKYPGIYSDQNNPFNSLIDDGVLREDTDVPGDQTSVEHALDAEQLGMTAEYQHWQMLQDQGLVDVTYETWLKTYGVSGVADENAAPTQDDYALELQKGQGDYRIEPLRYVRKWTYPTNHIDPTNGTPTSAVSWSIAERSDKKRFFKYPGFVFGVAVTRPKVYLGAQKGALVGLLDDWKSWMPATLLDQSFSSMKKIVDSATDGPLLNQTGDMWLDLRDLFIYGDQFVNHTDSLLVNSLALPGDVVADAANTRKVTEAMVDALFVGDTTKAFIKHDGKVSLDIMSRVIGRDTTKGGAVS